MSEKGKDTGKQFDTSGGDASPIVDEAEGKTSAGIIDSVAKEKIASTMGGEVAFKLVGWL